MTPLILYVAYIRMETENAWIIISWVSWYHWTRDVTGPLHPAAGAGWALSLNSGNLSSSSARRRTHATTATASPVLEDKTQLWEWCCGAAAPSSSTAPQQDVCCGAVRGMALTPTLAVAPGLCSALAPLWPGPTSGHCGQCRAGIKWNEAHYVGLTRGSVQCLLVLSCCGGGMCSAARCWLDHWSRPTPFLRRTGWRGVHWSGAAGTGTCGDGPAQNTWVWHPPLHRPCSALSTHSAEYPHWSRWLGSSAAELAALAQWMARDTQHRYAGLGWAGLGWPWRYINISYNYRESGRWLAAAGLSRRPTGLVTFTLVLARPPLATTGHHWHMSPHSPGLLHLSPHCFPQSETRTGSSSGRQESGVIAMYGLAVLLFMLAVTTWQWNMIMFCEFDCLMKPDNIHSSVCVFFESYLKSSNFIAGTSWVVSVVMPCAEFLLSPGRGPGSSSAQPAGRWGVRGQVRWTDTAPCHQPDCHCRSYFRNKRSPVTGLTRNCSLCVTEHQWMLGAAGLVTSPAQCPLLPAGPRTLVPWCQGPNILLIRFIVLYWQSGAGTGTGSPGSQAPIIRSDLNTERRGEVRGGRAALVPGNWELLPFHRELSQSHTFTIQKPDIKICLICCSVCLHCTAPLMDAMLWRG